MKGKLGQFFMCAGPAFMGFLIGFALGAILIILMYKGVIPGPFKCP